MAQKQEAMIKMVAGLSIGHIEMISLQGYRPFQSFAVTWDTLEILVGANGSGKTALFEFLRILRDGMGQEIPPGVLPDALGQQIFHQFGPEQFSWRIEFSTHTQQRIYYQATILGPLGRIHVTDEAVDLDTASAATRLLTYPNNGNFISLREGTEERNYPQERGNALALGIVRDAGIATVYNLREHIQGWRFYNPAKINFQDIRRPILIEQEPSLREDAGNLGSVLHYLFTEHPSAFAALQQFLRSTVPGFQGMSVKARGGPGQVMTFWQEGNSKGDFLTLADLSDGTLRLLCWGALCVHPSPPTLVCIDEPEQGVHPRTLPFLAGMLKKLASHTQVVVATHSSYFLTQFDLSQIGVMRKENGEVICLKPQDSKMFTAMLEDFGAAEIEILHRSDELEHLA